MQGRTHCVAEDSTFSDSEDNVEASPYLFGSMELEESSEVLSTSQSSRTEIQEIASALRSIFDPDHPTIKMIERRLDSCTQSTTEELALGLAHLALLEPENLPAEAKERLRKTSAHRPTS